MANDIASIQSGDQKLEIRHPKTDEPIGLRIGLVSIEDKALDRIKRKITDRRLHLEARGKTFKAEEIEENRLEILFGAMTGWEWYSQDEKRDEKGMITQHAIEQPNFHGVVPDFDRRNATDVLTALPWIGDQISAKIGETKDFF